MKHAGIYICPGLSPLARGTRASGLSPLARGTLYVEAPFSPPGRFIPAGAGNTKNDAVFHYWVPVYPRWRGEHPLKYSPVV
ncbi:hypothetical protein ECP03022934_3141 [Escherichia coli P0302293.4]|nr:hypothetical protein ECP03022934_3141 [Escherichia coli P0302293.4]